jgi:hypothetical protein
MYSSEDSGSLVGGGQRGDHPDASLEAGSEPDTGDGRAGEEPDGRTGVYGDQGHYDADGQGGDPDEHHRSGRGRP